MHEHHNIMENDDNFVNGTLYHLIPGNEGRVLDGRRTPGFIESYDHESSMFIWRITAFEDEGRCWEIPAEEISSYQFRKNSAVLSEFEVQTIEKQCEKFQQILSIEKNEDEYLKTMDDIEACKLKAKEWLKRNSRFVLKGKKLDFNANCGDEDLFLDLEEYMKHLGLYEVELKTTNQYLLNPQSGEWIKGLKIVMAEMGLIDFAEKRPRTNDIFTGFGEKEIRKKYIINRMAFVQSVFELSDVCEVPLYRGMSSTINLFETPCTLVSTTFSSETAKEFASIDNCSSYRSCYFVKFTYPISNIFMTFFETKQFNERYMEQEAIILHRNKLSF